MGSANQEGFASLHQSLCWTGVLWLQRKGVQRQQPIPGAGSASWEEPVSFHQNLCWNGALCMQLKGAGQHPPSSQARRKLPACLTYFHWPPGCEDKRNHPTQNKTKGYSELDKVKIHTANSDTPWLQPIARRVNSSQQQQPSLLSSQGGPLRFPANALNVMVCKISEGRPQT